VSPSRKPSRAKFFVRFPTSPSCMWLLLLQTGHVTSWEGDGESRGYILFRSPPPLRPNSTLTNESSSSLCSESAASSRCRHSAWEHYQWQEMNPALLSASSLVLLRRYKFTCAVRMSAVEYSGHEYGVTVTVVPVADRAGWSQRGGRYASGHVLECLSFVPVPPLGVNS